MNKLYQTLTLACITDTFAEYYNAGETVKVQIKLKEFGDRSSVPNMIRMQLGDQ